MERKLPAIANCDATMCAYNVGKKCHTLAITVGDGGCPLCDTAIKSEVKAGIPEMNAEVGACKVDECEYNDSLECRAHGVNIKMHRQHAECGTFKPRE
jgi:hypothetical protein